ncbi:unnamed protein product [Oppiella nova]|uniref:Uncharacterized protein n=1 Tax=Oppiella nova TaxID=334625 RepID=A0A7R9QMH8_9ACAR|nr:unnamed protein product [Oppiella nova]CAG2167961.1 unnamed protein product [Oppiella nova]
MKGAISEANNGFITSRLVTSSAGRERRHHNSWPDVRTGVGRSVAGLVYWLALSGNDVTASVQSYNPINPITNSFKSQDKHLIHTNNGMYLLCICGDPVADQLTEEQIADQ